MTRKRDTSRDTELLDALEAHLKRTPRRLLIHMDGYDVSQHPPGLGLACTNRSLRQALGGMLGIAMLEGHNGK
jgi:hypothetical protein